MPQRVYPRSHAMRFITLSDIFLQRDCNGFQREPAKIDEFGEGI
jgi:hypothetical protein